MVNSAGNRLDNKNFRDRQFYPLLEELKIISKREKGVKHRLTPHSARHTFISMMVAKKAQAELLQKIAGHKKYNTTIDFYNQLDEDSIKAMLSEVEKIQ